MVSFRYACADQKEFNLFLAYILFLPFKWGDNQAGSELIVELITSIAMEKGVPFAIREGGRTVASGQVLEIIE